MASSKAYITHNMSAYAREVLAKARKKAYPDLRGLDDELQLIVDDIIIPKEVYPDNYAQWSYNYISFTKNNMYGETAIDLLINMRMKINWVWENADEATVKYWMGLINSRVLAKKNRDFKVNLYMPGFGFIESIWNTGAPITGQAIAGSGHDGIIGDPGSTYYLWDYDMPSHIEGKPPKVYNYETDKLGDTWYYGQHYDDKNAGISYTEGVTDYSKFEIHWIEKKGIRLNTIKDLDIQDIIDDVDEIIDLK